MKRFSQFKLTKGFSLLFVVTAINLVYYAFPVYYYDALHVQAQLSQLQQQPSQQQQKPSPIISVKITSPSTGQQVPAGELTISGRSTDNPTTDCTVYADWNNTKPFQKTIATGPGGVDDYSTWTFTYTDKYHLITNGTMITLNGTDNNNKSSNVGNTANYLWRQTNGPAIILNANNTAHPSFVAPNYPNDTKYTFALEVFENQVNNNNNNKQAESAVDTVDIIAKDVNTKVKNHGSLQDEGTSLET